MRPARIGERHADEDTMHGPRGSYPGPHGARTHGTLLADPGSCTIPDEFALTRSEWDEQQTPPTPIPTQPESEASPMGGRRNIEFNKKASTRPTPAFTPPPTSRRAQDIIAARRKKTEGRFIAVQVGKAFKGSSYHLYSDCGFLTGPIRQAATNTVALYGEGAQPPEYVIKDASEEVIELLGLTACRHCENQSVALTFSDVIDLCLMDEFPTRTEAEVIHTRRALLNKLDEYGFAIRKARSQSATDDEE